MKHAIYALLAALVATSKLEGASHYDVQALIFHIFLFFYAIHMRLYTECLNMKRNVLNTLC